MIDFIGIGAQKSGTSWIHACLFEHPEICSPVKEIHFFSRERYIKGLSWYETHFSGCKSGTKKGEFSTSYLYTKESARRIVESYPDAKIVVVLREPAARAYSQYRNAIKAGEISETVSFDVYLEMEESCIAQGLYTAQLERYFNTFGREQVLVMVYEDIQKDSLAFIQKIYTHIGVDTAFVPPSVQSRINVARTPKNVRVDIVMHAVAEWLRRYGASSLVHIIKSSGITDLIRLVNSKKSSLQEVGVMSYKKYFKDDVVRLSQLLERDMIKEWEY